MVGEGAMTGHQWSLTDHSGGGWSVNVLGSCKAPVCHLWKLDCPGWSSAGNVVTEQKAARKTQPRTLVPGDEEDGDRRRSPASKHSTGVNWRPPSNLRKPLLLAVSVCE